MAPRYAHVHAEGDWGIRLGKGNLTIEVWDKQDKRMASISVGHRGVSVGGRKCKRAAVLDFDELNRRELGPAPTGKPWWRQTDLPENQRLISGNSATALA